MTAAALVVLGAAAQVNAYFAQFPTPRALFGLPPAGQVNFTDLHLSPHPATRYGDRHGGGGDWHGGGRPARLVRWVPDGARPSTCPHPGS